ncbi:MAG: DUF2911 domain-containing protein [Gemmatimonadales bacterium]
MTRSLTMLLAAMTLPAGAQGIPFSQHGIVSQRVGLTTITIEANRPVARGRTLFGDLIPWGSIWHPGADSATTFTTDRSIAVEGQTLPAGRYSVWTIPTESRWTVIFSRQANVYHTPYPGEAHDILRVTVAPTPGSHMETMAFYFPVVQRDRAVLMLHWGTVAVPIALAVDNGDN